MATDPNSALFALLAQLTGNSGAYQQQTGPGYSYGYPQGYSPYGYQSVPSGYNQQPYGYNPYSQGYSPYYQPYQQPPPNQNPQSAPNYYGTVGVPAIGSQPLPANTPAGNVQANDPNSYINSLLATLTGNQQPIYGNASTGPSQGSTWNYGITSADPGGNPGSIALRGGAPDAGHVGGLNFSSPTPAPIPGTGAAGPSSIAGLYGTDGTTPTAPAASSTSSSSSSSGSSFNAADPWGSVSNRKPELNSSWSGLWGG